MNDPQITPVTVGEWLDQRNAKIHVRVQAIDRAIAKLAGEGDGGEK